MRDKNYFKPGDIVKHFKYEFNNEIERKEQKYLYEIICTGVDTNTLTEAICYKGLYAPYNTYIRPLDEFLSLVDKEKYPCITQQYRFEKVECETEQKQVKGITIVFENSDTIKISDEYMLLSRMDYNDFQKQVNVLCLIIDKQANDNHKEFGLIQTNITKFDRIKATPHIAAVVIDDDVQNQYYYVTWDGDDEHNKNQLVYEVDGDLYLIIAPSEQHKRLQQEMLSICNL